MKYSKAYLATLGPGLWLNYLVQNKPKVIDVIGLGLLLVSV